jgi:hypothetical protein
MVSLRRHFVPNPVSSSETDFAPHCKSFLLLHTRYDNTDQVTGATYNYQSNEAYTYDANGNRTNTGYSTGTGNRLNSDGTYNYQYPESVTLGVGNDRLNVGGLLYRDRAWWSQRERLMSELSAA